MSAPPNRTDLAGTPTVATYKIAIGLLYDYVAGLLGNGTATIATSAEQIKAREYLGVGLTGFKNRLVNPEFKIDQENAGALVSIPTGTAKYILDQWYSTATGAAITAQQIAGINSREYSLRFTGATSNTGHTLIQRIEASSCADLKNQTVTVSFKSKASSARTITWVVSYATVKDNFTTVTQIGTGTLNITTSVSDFSFSFNAGANAGNGLTLSFAMPALLAGATIDFDQMQLEKSSIPTEFQNRSEQQELAMCQRYWQKLTYLVDTGGNNSTMSYLVEMRATPTITGGGSGFQLTESNSKTISAYQTTRAQQNLVFNARL